MRRSVRRVQADVPSAGLDFFMRLNFFGQITDQKICSVLLCKAISKAGSVRRSVGRA